MSKRQSVLRTGVYFLEQALEVVTQVRTVFGFEGTKLVDLSFEQRTLLIQLGEDVLVLVLSISDDLIAYSSWTR